LNRKIVLLIVILIILISFWVAKTNKPDSNSSIKMPHDDPYTDTAFSNWKTFSDTKVGFSVKYPSEWKVEESNDKMILADIAKDNSVGFQIRMYQNFGNDFNQFVADYLEAFENDMTSHWNGVIKQISTRSNIYDQINFNRTKFNFKRPNGEEWFLIEYIWSKDNTIIAFQSGILAEKVTEFEPLLDSIADSFEFTD